MGLDYRGLVRSARGNARTKVVVPVSERVCLSFTLKGTPVNFGLEAMIDLILAQPGHIRAKLDETGPPDDPTTSTCRFSLNVEDLVSIVQKAAQEV